MLQIKINSMKLPIANENPLLMFFLDIIIIINI
jgi:hypothetical protein